jgi:hypothetical protein
MTVHVPQRMNLGGQVELDIALLDLVSQVKTLEGLFQIPMAKTTEYLTFIFFQLVKKKKN